MTDLYQKYNLRRIINACGKMTHLSGAAVLPEIVADVTAALPCFFELDELQERAGERIAEATGAEWGCVTACTASGITLGVAACMTGEDLGKVAQLPDTEGMKDEVVLQKGHAVNFGAPITQMIRLAGARVRELGTVNGTRPFHLEHAINERTAAAVFVQSHHTVQYGFIPLKPFVEICHARGVPVIVDGAAQDLVIRDLIASGADLVITSAHKYLCSTTAGLVAGRKELVRAVYAQNRGIGRGMKVGKEGIIGLMAALELRARTDVRDWQAEQDRKMHRILDQLQDLPGITLGIDPDPSGNPFSRARLTVDPARAGLTAAAVCEALRQGDPAIHPRGHHVDEGYFTLDAIEMTDAEIDLTCKRVREILRQ
jgi:L-seryl-tRNA(Ser) seleniumtransferase